MGTLLVTASLNDEKELALSVNIDGVEGTDAAYILGRTIAHICKEQDIDAKLFLGIVDLAIHANTTQSLATRAAELRAATTSPSDDIWEPIAEAPKDGTLINIRLSGGDHLYGCKYYKPLNTFKGEGWVDANECFISSLTTQTPTHFCPRHLPRMKTKRI